MLHCSPPGGQDVELIIESVQRVYLQRALQARAAIANLVVKLQQPLVYGQMHYILPSGNLI